MRAIALMLLGCAAGAASSVQAAGDASPAMRIDGDEIRAPLEGKRGDVARGRAIVANRQVGLCLLCHTGPIPEERFQGNLAPDLSGAGSRWSEGQLRLRIADAVRLNPATIMPSYYRTEGLARVSPAVQGKPILDAQQIEDVVAYLRTLRNGAAEKNDEAK
ncbi:sulfur oxidation c-type cytochrome SoxX [Noviherbaspirillum sp. CPCC 100848]|uniref:Sulfur oxidation c-type cytochrome SoxX n=1 Tax=Noviherbaspirillum album TaxID=3080276 RepID=A0ABU6J958_9BURK|nr:sulfur oxidation c-type cytochrome SoxX [Noviherbaspirillum sp. CPCC 100848]MEC4719976.1 sulfur oxidation c-type cytochrome SoxX [Noviherbaspirillum sp. CPCC 100848]